MKKTLIIIILCLLLILIYLLCFKQFSLLGWENSSIKRIQDLSNDLDGKIKTATNLKEQEYPSKKEKLESSIKDLEKAKEKYLNKTKNLSENVELGVIEVKQYKIERLWIVLQNYAKDCELDLKLDIAETQTNDVYDLNVTTTGSYIGITDFIYAIEKDDTLGFKILDFKLLPSTAASTETQVVEEGNTTKTETVQTTTVYVDKLTATFKIENVGINFE